MNKFFKYLLNACSVTDTVLGAEDTSENRADNIRAPEDYMNADRINE